LALGHPFRWVLERNGEGLRIRDLSGEADRLQRGKMSEIPYEKIASGQEIEIDVSRGFKFKIRSIRPTQPLFAQKAQTGNTLRIYRCVGNWVMQSERLAGKFSAKLPGQDSRKGSKKTAFSLTQNKTHWLLKVSTESLLIKEGGGEARALKAGEIIELAPEALARVELKAASGTSWHFGLTDAPEFVDAPRARATGTAGSFTSSFNDESEWFRKSLLSAVAGMLLFALIAWLWPAQKNDLELVPAQYTQILTAKLPKAAAQATPESGSSSLAKEAPKKVRDAAVVQAFRAKALSSAVNGLLKGGMTKLLAQSEFVSGMKAGEARRILDTSNVALQPTTTLGSLTGAKNVQIASVGGDAHGDGGHNVGYGKGEHAQVKGQGKGFVPFVQADANGAVVDEGLTREEVGEVIHRHLSEVRYCYESAMLRSPDIEGKLMAAFTIGASGAVKTADAKTSTLPDPRLDDCIIRRLVSWPFPKPRGGVEVSVTYPFIFKTLGR
jgi:hypothetical protein